MNALASYLRALLIFWLGGLIEKFGLPVEGSGAAVDFLATGVVVTAVWAVSKYGKAIAKNLGDWIGGRLPLLLALLMLGITLVLSSCMTTRVIAPDGTVTETTAPVPGAIELAGQGIAVIGARARVVEQKSFSADEQAQEEMQVIEWEGTPNPLDVPWDTAWMNWHPESMGHFGPFGSMWGRTY